MRRMMRWWWTRQLRRAELRVLIYREKLSWKTVGERMETVKSLNKLMEMPTLSRVGGTVVMPKGVIHED